MLTRRNFLSAAVRLSAGVAMFPAINGLADLSTSIVVRPQGSRPVASVPANFMGLGYEMSSAARLGLLSTRNRPYRQLLGNLGPRGVLRFGGIVSSFTRYDANGVVAAEAKNTVITRASLEQLREFLDATGWTAIWSLNFGRGNLNDAVIEARDVATVLESRLEAIELGNEVEEYGSGKAPLRRRGYSYEDYRAEYATWHAALVQAVPGLRFAAPDTASSVEWVERMAADAHGEVQLLTTHYYRGGQQQGSLDQLMNPDSALKSKLERLTQAARQSGIPWRMCETNSFFGGGRPGVSDTFAGALWTLDYMLLLAQSGCSGVNMETGLNQLGFVSCYSPIQDDGKGHNTAGMPYYGMLAFAAATSQTPEMFPVEYDARGVNLAMYVLGIHGRARTLVVVNRDSARDAHIAFAALEMRDTKALRLVAPALDSSTSARFAGSAVDPAGHWGPTDTEEVRDGHVFVPHSSAIVLRSKGPK